MKLLVVSDSHLYENYLQRVVTHYRFHVDYMIHCGDSSLPVDDPYIQLFDIVVKGNHDDAPFLSIKHFNISVLHMDNIMEFIMDMIN